MQHNINFIHIPKNAGSTMRNICNIVGINYHNHNTNVYSDIPNQLVILRDPIERFESAVFYALEKYSHEPHIKRLLDHRIDTPSK